MPGRENIGYKFSVYALVVPMTLFYCLLLCGCISTSPGIPNLHLVQLELALHSYIRLGYYGICALGQNSTSCISTAFSTKETVLRKLNETLPQLGFPDDLLSATELQVDLFINVLVVGGFMLFLAIIIEGVQIYSLKRQRKVSVTPATLRRQNFYRQFSLALAWASSACAFAASIANT